MKYDTLNLLIEDKWTFGKVLWEIIIQLIKLKLVGNPPYGLYKLKQRHLQVCVSFYLVYVGLHWQSEYLTDLHAAELVTVEVGTDDHVNEVIDI